jgi:hypothetical protein
VSENGAIKFTCQQVPVEIGAFAGFAELNEYRRKLLELGSPRPAKEARKPKSVRGMIV